MTKAATFEETSLSIGTFDEMMQDLHNFISSLHRPKFSDSDWAEAKHSDSQELSARIDELLESLESRTRTFSESVSTSLTRMQNSLSEYSAELMDQPSGKRLQALYEELAEDYEELLKNIRTHKTTKIKAIHLKPTNYVRNAFHVFCGLTCVLLYEFALARKGALIVLGCFLAPALFMEITRRYSTRWNDFLMDKLFGLVSRPHERSKANGSTNFLVAMFLLVIFFDKPVVQMAILILAFADPAASVVGKLWGRRKLFKDKSVIGTTTFFAVAFSVTMGFLTLAVPAFSVGYALLVACVVSLVATATELFSTRIDDNFSIPMLSALAAMFFF